MVRKPLAYILVMTVIMGFLLPGVVSAANDNKITLVAGEPAYSPSPVPAHGSAVEDRRPVLKWEVYPNGNPIVEFRMLLDGKAVKAVKVQDGHTVEWSYQPEQDLSPGKHTLVCQVTFKKYLPIQLTSAFTIVDRDSLTDPFQGKDKQKLATLELQAIETINTYRAALGLNLLTVNERLSRSAQAHSNYMQVNSANSHREHPNYPGFTGVSPQDRAAYYSYPGTVSDGLSFRHMLPRLHISGLMDAPYHRLGLINPNDSEAGIGLNLPHNLVVAAGTQNQRTNDAAVAYPYPGQQNAKISWFVAESPNPLAWYRLDQVYVGYPVSLSLHDSNTRELRFIAGNIKDNLGQDVPYYLVDSTKEDQFKQHVFLIPKQILTPGMTYTVSIQAERVMTDGTTAPVRREWRFTTQKQPLLDYTGIERFEGIENIAIKYAYGNLPDLGYVLYKNGEIVRRYQAQTGYSWDSKPVLESGVYKLQAASSYLPSFMEYELAVSGVGENKQVSVRTERALGQVPAIRAGLIRLGGREHIELLFSGKNPQGLQYTLTKAGKVWRTYHAKENRYYTYRGFELTNGEYQLDVITDAAAQPQKFVLVISGKKETRTVLLTPLAQ